MSNVFGNMIVVYRIEGNVGVPEATIEGPWPEGTEELYTNAGRPTVIMERAGVGEIWVDIAGEIPIGRLREDGPWSISGSVYAVDSDPALVISDLPVGAKIFLGQEQYTIDDGTFEFTSSTTGAFTYKISHWPFFDYNGQVMFQ